MRRLAKAVSEIPFMSLLSGHFVYDHLTLSLKRLFLVLRYSQSIYLAGTPISIIFYS